jgi:hypothetical protein
MALFNVSVLLHIPRPEREALQRIAAALEGLVAKLDEPAPDPDDSQGVVDALVARLAASNTALADEVAKILAVHPTPPHEGA